MDAWQILILDTDADARRGLASYLGSRGYRVAGAATAAELWRQLERRTVDVYVIDLRAFDDPAAALSRLRSLTRAAIIAGDTADERLGRILALEIGADDALPLPLSPRELLARIRGFQRRALAARGGDDVDYAFDGWLFRPAQHHLIGPDRDVRRLTRGECALLRLLAASPRKLMSRARLLQAVNPTTAVTTARSVDVVVARLRRKLGAARTLIAVERGLGYRLDCEVSRRAAASAMFDVE
ncbi:response regulator transcription factor [Tahibacter caeni]|uniref:response regulator transcription factor n=1 Tax=Tahibacter caeni TaxID=1453545 RepID=UPI0021496C66|nr:response regulator transcription factor [Tahibacter caeni]